MTTNLWSLGNMCTAIEQPRHALLHGGKILRDGFLCAAASWGLGLEVTASDSTHWGRQHHSGDKERGERRLDGETT